MKPCSGESDLLMTRAGGGKQHGGPDLICLHGREAKGGWVDWRIGFLRNSVLVHASSHRFYIKI